MRMEVQLGNIRQLMHSVDRLDDRQKRALQSIIYSMDYDESQSMPSWIHGTRQQWLDYLNGQKKHAVQITPQAKSWLAELKPYLSGDQRSSIDLRGIIDQDPDLKHFKQQNPLPAVLLASRITADREAAVHPLYHNLIRAFADLVDPHAKSFDKTRELSIIYHNLIRLSRHFTSAEIAPQITQQAINNLHRELSQLHPLAKIPGSKSMVASLIAHHTYAELNQLARLASLSFRHTATAHQFVDLFLEQLDQLKSSRFEPEKKLLPKLAKKSIFSRTYQAARRHPQQVLNFLSELANLNADNRLAWIKEITRTISQTPRLRSLSAARSLVSCAESTVSRASSASASDAAAGLFNKMVHQSDGQNTDLFNTLVSRLTSDRDASRWRGIIRFAKKDLKSSRTLLKFLERFLDQIKELHGRITDRVKYYVALMIRFSDDYELNTVYQLLRQHVSTIGAILDRLASLTRRNQITDLDQLAKTINRSPLASLGAFHMVQSNASSIASQADARRQSYLNARSNASNANEIFSSLLNDGTYTEQLFSALVSRLTAAKASLTWREGVALVEYDFNNSLEFGPFIQRLSRLIGNQHGRIVNVLRYFIRLMCEFDHNPQLNRSYRILHKHRQTVVKIMEAIRTLDADNQYYNFSQIIKAANASELDSVSAVRFLASAASQQIPDSFRKAVVSRSTAQRHKARLLSNALRERSQLSRALSINSRVNSSKAAASAACSSNYRSSAKSSPREVNHFSIRSSGNYSAAHSASSGRTVQSESSATSSSIRDLLMNMNQWLDALNSRMSKK